MASSNSQGDDTRLNFMGHLSDAFRRKAISVTKYNGDSQHIPGRLERLLRERELRKSRRGIHSNSNKSSEKNEEGYEQEVQQQRVGVRELEDDVERRRRSETRQEVVVVGNVANRLPVSAIRKGEDSWSLVSEMASSSIQCITKKYDVFVSFQGDIRLNFRDVESSCVDTCVATSYLMLYSDGLDVFILCCYHWQPSEYSVLSVFIKLRTAKYK